MAVSQYQQAFESTECCRKVAQMYVKRLGVVAVSLALSESGCSSTSLTSAGVTGGAEGYMSTAKGYSSAGTLSTRSDAARVSNPTGGASSGSSSAGLAGTMGLAQTIAELGGASGIVDAGAEHGGMTGTSGFAPNGGTRGFSATGALSTLGVGGTPGTGGVGDGGFSPITGTLATAGAAGFGCEGKHEHLDISKRLCAANMATVLGPSADVATYEIDVTEVTRGQYESWLRTAPIVNGSFDCASNSDLTANAACMSGPTVCKGSCDHQPQVCIDWCDAYAYCAAVGKHLCGKIGGGQHDSDDYANPLTSEWYRACSAGGTRDYPYGSTYRTSYCNGSDFWPSANNCVATDVGTLTYCTSSEDGYSDVYDMSGNVWEWENSCEGNGSTALCHVRGGAFNVGRTEQSCKIDHTVARAGVYHSIGFRCCG